MKEREEEKDGQRHGDLRCSNVALAGAAEETRTVRSPGPWAVEVVPGGGLTDRGRRRPWAAMAAFEEREGHV